MFRHHRVHRGGRHSRWEQKSRERLDGLHQRLNPHQVFPGRFPQPNAPQSGQRLGENLVLEVNRRVEQLQRVPRAHRGQVKGLLPCRQTHIVIRCLHQRLEALGHGVHPLAGAGPHHAPGLRVRAQGQGKLQQVDVDGVLLVIELHGCLRVLWRRMTRGQVCFHSRAGGVPAHVRRASHWNHCTGTQLTAQAWVHFGPTSDSLWVHHGPKTTPAGRQARAQMFLRSTLKCDGCFQPQYGFALAH